MRSGRSAALATAVGGLALLLALLAPTGAGAAPGGNETADEARRRHERAVKYWTAERIANAKPMDLTTMTATARP